jgi:serine/threonine protein kinase
MMIEDDDILFFSHMDDFIPPMDVITEDATRIEGEKIPHTVGGYKVGELLGRGGFGEVRVGEHHLTGERVALKFLRKSEIHSLLAAERTNTEIQCLQALKHNNIIRLQQVDLIVLSLLISF